MNRLHESVWNICLLAFKGSNFQNLFVMMLLGFVPEEEVPKGRNAQRLEAKAKTKNKSSKIVLFS